MTVNILLIKDTQYWASHITVQNIINHINSSFRCEDRKGLWYKKGDERFDIVYVHCNNGVPRNKVEKYRSENRRSKILAGVRGWAGFRSTLLPWDAVNVDNLKLLEAVRKIRENVYLCHAGVDTKLFKPMTNARMPVGEVLRDRQFLEHKMIRDKRFTIGWVGNKMKNYRLVPRLGFPFKVATIKRQPEPHYPHGEMPYFYNNIDALVLVSSEEGCPLPVLEAGACGKPVIATTAKSATMEYLDEFQLIRKPIRAEGFDEMRRKLMMLRDDPELMRRLGTRNRRVAVERWAWPVKVKQYEVFFKSVL